MKRFVFQALSLTLCLAILAPDARAFRSPDRSEFQEVRVSRQVFSEQALVQSLALVRGSGSNRQAYLALFALAAIVWGHHQSAHASESASGALWSSMVLVLITAHAMAADLWGRAVFSGHSANRDSITAPMRMSAGSASAYNPAEPSEPTKKKKNFIEVKEILAELGEVSEVPLPPLQRKIADYLLKHPKATRRDVARAMRQREATVKVLITRIRRLLLQEVKVRREESSDVDAMGIETLRLGTHIEGTLKNPSSRLPEGRIGPVETIGQLSQMTEPDLLARKGLNQYALNVIRLALWQTYGFTLLGGALPPEAPKPDDVDQWGLGEFSQTLGKALYEKLVLKAKIYTLGSLRTHMKTSARWPSWTRRDEEKILSLLRTIDKLTVTPQAEGIPVANGFILFTTMGMTIAGSGLLLTLLVNTGRAIVEWLWVVPFLSVSLYLSRPALKRSALASA